MMKVYDAHGNQLDILGDTEFRLKGHSWSILGDSISTDIGTIPGVNNIKYWVWINERVGGMDVYNYGVSGTRVTNFTQRYSDMHYSDIITVFGGVNDWGQSGPTPLGEFGDTTNSTFYGALDILCSGILTTFPKSLVIFITPLGNGGFSNWPTDENSLGLTIYDYADAIINVCAKYKIPVIDACRSSLLNAKIEAIKTECFKDGVHPNNHGHEVLSWLIEDEMLKHYIPSISDT